MKNLICFLLLSALVSACNQKANQTEEHASGTYACPMKCEGATVYAEPGKCPVCGMDLRPVEGGQPATAYQMQITTQPEIPDAGKPVKLIMRPRVIGNDSMDVPLDVVHEEKIHVIIVSQDLGYYAHIHPQYQPDGTYAVDHTFEHGGVYVIFADYQPSGSGNEVERQSLAVNGVSKPKQDFKTQELTSSVDGYAITLHPTQGKLITNNLLHLNAEVSLNGQPVTQFENVMGAKGHLVIISADGQNYIHVHPVETNGVPDLHVQFDQPGLYRAFYQFQTEGVLHTAAFTLQVDEGKAGDLPQDHGHDHNHGTDHQH